MRKCSVLWSMVLLKMLVNTTVLLALRNQRRSSTVLRCHLAKRLSTCKSRSKKRCSSESKSWRSRFKLRTLSLQCRNQLLKRRRTPWGRSWIGSTLRTNSSSWSWSTTRDRLTSLIKKTSRKTMKSITWRPMWSNKRPCTAKRQRRWRTRPTRGLMSSKACINPWRSTPRALTSKIQTKRPSRCCSRLRWTLST